jgi:PhzF family phenazine biosynthesis protein
MTQGAIEFSDPIPKPQRTDILSALGLDASDLDERCPIQIVSTGHSKVLIGIRKAATLNSLKPNLARLVEMSDVIKCNGYFVFSLDLDSQDILAHGRMFAPAIGIPEDPVTGNANGPLGAYLVQHGLASRGGGVFSFKTQQGEAMGRPGIIEVTVELEGGRPRTVRIGGHAVVAFEGTIEI